MEDVECGKYKIVFASAENILVKLFFHLLKKKKKNSHTVSPEYAGLHQTKYGG